MKREEMLKIAALAACGLISPGDSNYAVQVTEKRIEDGMERVSITLIQNLRLEDDIDTENYRILLDYERVTCNLWQDLLRSVLKEDEYEGHEL